MPAPPEPSGVSVSGRSADDAVLRVLDSISEGFLALDPDWRIIYLNEAAHQMFAPRLGENSAPILGQSHWDVFPEAIGTALESEYRRAAEHRVVVEFENHYAPWDAWFRIRASPVRGGGISVYFREITAEKRAAEALRESEARYRSLFESIDEGFCVLQIIRDEHGRAVDYRFLEVNPAFEKQTGLVDAVGRRAREAVPTLEDFWVETYGAIARTREPRRFVQHAESMGRWYDVYAFPIGAPELDHVALLFTDITARRRAEELQRFFVELDDAVRPLSDPAAITATAARVLAKHLGADRCAYAEVEEDENRFHLLGDFCRGVPSIVGHYALSDFGAEVLRLNRANQPFVVDDIETHEPRPADLSSYRATQIRAVISVPLHKGGRFVAGMAVHQKTPRHWTREDLEVTRHAANRCWEALERTRVARDLAESESRFRTLVERSPFGIYVVDAGFRIVLMNEAGQNGAFRNVRPVIGRDFAEAMRILWPEQVAAEIVAYFQHTLETGEPYYSHDFVNPRADVRKTEGYEWELHATTLANGQRGVICYYFDSTRLREAKAQADAANHAKDEFLAALSHELRTPLTPVLMAAEELCEDASLPSSMHTALCMMRRNIQLEARLIDDLLDLTRISNGKLVLLKQPCDLHLKIRNALEIVGDEARHKQITLDVRLAAARPHVEGDPARLQQVLWNVLKNAVKFTPSGGRIVISTSNAGDAIVVEVSDTGIGIAPEYLDRIFRPFEQGPLGHEHRFGGLGLGLSIARAITTLHGGDITAGSQGPGRGATFRVSLPTTHLAPEPAQAPPATPAQPAPAMSRLRLLLVEDHEHTREMLSRLLTKAGHEVRAASDVASAKALAAAHRFDGVVSDIGLPDGSGIDLMSHLRATHDLSGIALSGYGMEEDLRRSYEAGFVAHLVKPVDFAQLRQALPQLVR